MTTTTTVPAIERRLELAASPERVWRALTEPAELVAWFGQEAEFTASPGATGWVGWEGHGRFPLRVVEADAPRRLVLRWLNQPDAVWDEERATTVEWTLEPRADGGTILHLRESGFSAPGGRSGNSAGWLHELAELVAHLAAEPWQAGIRRTTTLRTPRAEVWRAFTDAARFEAWWGGGSHPALSPGLEGWWDFGDHGRFAFRVDAVEPEDYLAWTWSNAPGVPLAESVEQVHTEWSFVAREDGGTDLQLFESGFRGPGNHASNVGGWDGDVLPGLRRLLEDGVAPASGG